MTKVVLRHYLHGPYCVGPAYLLYVSRGCSVSEKPENTPHGRGNRDAAGQNFTGMGTFFLLHSQQRRILLLLFPVSHPVGSSAFRSTLLPASFFLFREPWRLRRRFC